MKEKRRDLLISQMKCTSKKGAKTKEVSKCCSYYFQKQKRNSMLLRNKNVHYDVQNNPPLDYIPRVQKYTHSKINLMRHNEMNCLKIHFKILFSHTLKRTFPIQHFIHISWPPPVFCAQIYHIFFRRIEIEKQKFIYHTHSSLSCYLLS